MTDFKESIRIKNVGPLRDIYIEDIRPFTVFIGESASGKSTLMKIISLFRFVYKKTVIRSYLKNANIRRSPFRMQFETWVKNCGLESYLKEDSIIEYTVSTGFPNGFVYTINSRNKKLTSAIPRIRNEHLLFSKISFIPEIRNIIPKWEQSGQMVKNENIFGLHFHDAYKDFLQATEIIKSLDLDYINLEFSVLKGQNGKKRYIITPQAKKVLQIGDNIKEKIYITELRNASSGIQSSTPLSVLVRYFSRDFSFDDAMLRSIFSYLYENKRLNLFKPQIETDEVDKIVYVHVEEPELSLYPDSQCKLIDSLVRDCFMNEKREWKMGLMMATHSPYIINYLNVLIRAYYKNRDTQGITTIAHINPDNLAVYKVANGQLQDLKATSNLNDQIVINTIDLSETMDAIYQDYLSLE